MHSSLSSLSCPTGPFFSLKPHPPHPPTHPPTPHLGCHVHWGWFQLQEECPHSGLQLPAWAICSPLLPRCRGWGSLPTAPCQSLGRRPWFPHCAAPGAPQVMGCPRSPQRCCLPHTSPAELSRQLRSLTCSLAEGLRPASALASSYWGCPWSKRGGAMTLLLEHQDWADHPTSLRWQSLSLELWGHR